LYYYFVSKIEEYNAIFGQQQIENIHYTISLIEHKYKQDKIENLIRMNLQKCIQWCIKHNIEYNNIMNFTNIYSFDTLEIPTNYIYGENAPLQLYEPFTDDVEIPSIPVSTTNCEI
jgi:hypothetical protein